MRADHPRDLSPDLPDRPGRPAGLTGVRTRRGSLVGLLDRASSGDVTAVGAVYDEVAESVYRIVVLVVGDPDEAQDVCRQVFTQVWHEWDTSRQALDGPARSWLLATAYRRATDRAQQLDSRLRQPVGAASC